MIERLKFIISELLRRIKRQAIDLNKYDTIITEGRGNRIKITGEYKFKDLKFTEKR